jgi:hypothetical protein
MSFVKEVWYGQRSLAQTYWFWGGLIGTLVVGIGARLIAVQLVVLTRNLFPLLLYLALWLPIYIWITVGLWRSATNHPSGWATLVKVLTVIGVPLTVYYMAMWFSIVI